MLLSDIKTFWQQTGTSIHQRAVIRHLSPFTLILASFFQVFFLFLGHTSNCKHKPQKIIPEKLRENILKCSFVFFCLKKKGKKKTRICCKETLQKQTKKWNNGTDICWKQILNNQNCCKSSIFFLFFSTQAPEHETTEGGGGRGFSFSYFFFLKYTRNLHIIGRTCYAHTHTYTQLATCISILEVIAHPEGGRDRKLHMIRL